MASRNERDFVPVNIAILTVSDTRTLETDKSGRTLQELAEADGHKVVAREIVEDSAEAIAGRLRAWIAEPEVDVVLSTGGTGLTGRDVTPEAFKAVMEKEIEGFGELFRWLSYRTIGTSPGSPGACRDGWREILSAQLDYRSKPCNLVELMPRLRER
jgi:molybdenum cofactor biosynthesis protein B